MPLTYQAPTLQMEWCLDCHRDPAQFVRPKEEVFNMQWLRLVGETQAAIGAGW